MGKYAPLTRFLRQQEGHSITLSFGELEKILGFSLPGSAYRYSSWWANSANGQSQIRGWKDAGWETRNVDLSGRRVTFVRVRGEPVVATSAAGASDGMSTASSGMAATVPFSTSARAPAGTVGATSVADRSTEGLAKRARQAGFTARMDEALAAVIDVGRLPPQARRLLESRARANGRGVRAEAAAILSAALAEEKGKLITALADMRGRTRRPGAFDLLVVLGRKRA